MATNDIRSNLLVKLAQKETVVANGTTDGAGIDTANYELGLMFAIQASAWTDGAYALNIQESDTDSGYANISADCLIGALPSVGAATAEGGTLGTVGVFGNKRWVRTQIVATGVTVGAVAQVTCIQAGELAPVQ